MSRRLLRRAVLRLLAGARARRSPSGVAANKVCLFKPDGIGDFVLSIGAMRLMAEHHGEANCEIVVSSPVADLARAEFPLARILSLPLIGSSRGLERAVRGWFKWRQCLSTLTADTVFCLRHHRNLEEECGLLWMNARRVVGLINSTNGIAVADQAALPPTLTESAPRPVRAEPTLCLELDSHRQLLRLALRREISTEELLPRLVSAAPTPGSALLVAPFSSLAFKDYPNPLLVEAVAQLLARVRVPLQLAGSLSDRPRLEELRRLVGSRCGAPMELLPASSVVEFGRAIARARAVLTVDTAAAHLATALNKPAVVIHNGVHFGEFGPWCRSARQQWLVHSMDCFGCGGRCPYLQPECIHRVEPRTVAAALAVALE